MCRQSALMRALRFEADVLKGQKTGTFLDQRRGHPPDHPATFPEAHYLKAVYFERGR